MIEHEEVLRDCLSGHKDFVLNFGTDHSREDGLNPYCKVCVRLRSQAQREGKRSQGLAARGSVSTLNFSVQAIERHEAKRKQESEIAAKLRVEETETEVRRSSFAELVSFEGQKTFSPRWRVA